MMAVAFRFRLMIGGFGERGSHLDTGGGTVSLLNLASLDDDSSCQQARRRPAMLMVDDAIRFRHVAAKRSVKY